jgi:hypothetical protein
MRITSLRPLLSLMLASTCFLVGCAAPSATRTSPSAPAVTTESAAIPPYTLERFREERKLEQDVATIVVDNPYGEIQIRQSSGSSISIQTVEQRIGETPRIARLEWFLEAGTQGVRVRYDEHDPTTPADPRLGRVDLFVFVPSKLKVQAHADFGAIVIRRLDNAVFARSRSGTITVAARGAMDLESETGLIRAFAMSAEWAEPVRLRTGGGVLVDVPLFIELDLEVTAATGITADFELDQRAQQPDGRWTANHRVGGGTRKMWIESTAADVMLQGLKSPVR